MGCFFPGMKKRGGAKGFKKKAGRTRSGNDKPELYWVIQNQTR